MDLFTLAAITGVSDLRDELRASLPALPSQSGDYILRSNSGSCTYTPYVDPTKKEVGETLAGVLADVVGLNETHKYVNIAFFTDTHSNANNASEAIETMQRIQATKMMDACIHGGDLISTYDYTFDQYMDGIIKSLEEYKKYGDMLYVKGNHDDGHSATGANNASKYQYYMLMLNNMSNVVHNPLEKYGAYYYRDLENEKVRIIVLDSFVTQTTPSADIVSPSFGTNQLNWLYSTALNVQDGWTVIVFTHQILSTQTKTVNIFRAFNDRGTTYGDYMFSDSITTHFCGVVHGHEHTDSSRTSDGFNVIGVKNAFGDEWALDIFTIDTTNMKLIENRIGTGESREFTFT